MASTLPAVTDDALRAVIQEYITQDGCVPSACTALPWGPLESLFPVHLRSPEALTVGSVRKRLALRFALTDAQNGALKAVCTELVTHVRSLCLAQHSLACLWFAL